MNADFTVILGIAGKLAANQSIKARFLFSFIANLLKGSLNFLSGMLIAASLGPGNFGDYTFLIASFTAINKLVDMGTSSAFYTFISQRKRSKGFYVYYLIWVAFQFALTLLLITILLPQGWRERIWLGHETKLVITAFMASFCMNQVWNMMTSVGESMRRTLSVQIRNILVAAAYIGGIVILVRLQKADVPNLLIFNIGLYAAASLIFATYMKDAVVSGSGSRESFGSIAFEFRTYCAPLALSVWVSFAYTFADSWLLQRFGGAVQQGYYSIGERFSAVSLLATTSILQVFWKEIAEASGKGDVERMRGLFVKVTHALCFAAAFISCFLIPYSKDILAVFLGESYTAGWVALAIMLSLPIFQSLGQINGSFMYATGKTELYRNIVIGMTVLSIPATYFTLAPPDAAPGGLGLGASGLAAKMVILTIVNVNVQAFMITRSYGWKYAFTYQIVNVALLMALSFASKGIAVLALQSAGFSPSLPAKAITAMIIYAVFTIAILRRYPAIAGLSDNDVSVFMRYLRMLQGGKAVKAA